MKRRVGWVAAFGAACAVVFGGPSAARELPDGFRLEPVVGGLNNPSSIAFTKDARVFITERTTGALRLLRQGVLQPAPVCSVSVQSAGEAGLLGVAVHPQFQQNGWVYLYYTDLTTSLNRVTRFTIGVSSCSDPQTILADLGSGAGFLRNGGGMGFGPDGKLYVATGDVGVGANAQDGSSLRGKVLRVNDDGTIPVDNPTPGSLVYSLGLRDGRGIAINPSGQVYATDRGDTPTSVEDEVNAARPFDGVGTDGNLGWPIETGGGGVLDQPIEDWLPTIGVHGLAFGAAAFPDRRSDGLDNDFDRYGPDRYPGKARIDDDLLGICVGSVNFEQQCNDNTDCPARTGESSGGEFGARCELEDDPGEYCPGGSPIYDDVCGNTLAAGIDEPDEAFRTNLFTASSGGIERVVVTGAGLDQLSTTQVFLDSTPDNPTPPPPAITDCPSGWTGAGVGNDGWLYLVATNAGGPTDGALYRVIEDSTAGPREVSVKGSPFPLRVDKGASPGDVVLSWEDLRDDAKQPRDNGVNPVAPEREYTIWRGTIGSYYSHTPVSGLEAEAGTALNDAVRQKQVVGSAGTSEYFLISARHDNLNGIPGRNSAGVAQPGYADPEVCNSIGYYSTPAGPGVNLWKCGQNFTLRDEHGLSRSFYADFRGKAVLIDVSAIWCAPCNAQANLMETLYQDYKDRGVELVTILNDDGLNSGFAVPNPPDRPNPIECLNWGDRPGAAPDHTFTCFVDPGAWETGDTWFMYQNGPGTPGSYSWPSNILLDQGLRVIYHEQGYNEAAIRAKLDALLGAGDSCLH